MQSLSSCITLHGLLLSLAATPCLTNAFVASPLHHLLSQEGTTTISAATKNEGIEYQSDTTKYGRGDMHLSAALDTDDVIVYQTGTWLVDGVEVGTGDLPEYHYGKVETIQLVWTHNCEHGVIRALPLELLVAEDGRQILRIQDDECIEFGPEQLVAKIPLQWNEEAQEMESPLLLSDDLWEEASSGGE